jgi:hypothetical protein
MACLRRIHPGATLAIAWFDAHGDLNNTPTTSSGNVWGDARTTVKVLVNESGFLLTRSSSERWCSFLPCGPSRGPFGGGGWPLPTVIRLNSARGFSIRARYRATYANLHEPQLLHARLPSATDLRHLPLFFWFWTWAIRYSVEVPAPRVRRAACAARARPERPSPRRRPPARAAGLSPQRTRRRR